MKSSSVFLRKNFKSSQSGVALMEVLIAFFILSIGLLGLAALQVKTVQFNQGSYQRSQATVAAYDMLDRMRLNKTAASSGAYNIAWTDTGPGTGTMPEKDLTSWLASIKGNLPNGQASIECDIYKICDINIRWIDRFAAANTWEVLTVSAQLL